MGVAVAPCMVKALQRAQGSERLALSCQQRVAAKVLGRLNVVIFKDISEMLVWKDDLDP